MKLGEMNWKDFEDEKPKMAVIPTGSTEQHGPHGPLQTDTLIAEAIAEKAAKETKTLLLPSISAGYQESIPVFREHYIFLRIRFGNNSRISSSRLTRAG